MDTDPVPLMGMQYSKMLLFRCRCLFGLLLVLVLFTCVRMQTAKQLLESTDP